MKHTTLSKEPTVFIKPLQLRESLHNRLRFALAVIVCLFGEHCSQPYDEMTENVATSNPSLPFGHLNYLVNLKRPGSTAPGMFMYSSFGETSASNSQIVKFFDSEPLPSFVPNYQLTLAISGQISRCGFDEQSVLVTCNCSLLEDPSVNGMQIYLVYGTGNSKFSGNDNGFVANGEGSLILTVRSSDTKYRQLSSVGEQLDFFLLTALGSISTASKIISFELTNSEYIDQVTKIGIYALYMHRLGHILWDDETIPGNTIDEQLITDFQPKYAVGDFSRPCTADNCDIVVFQERDGNVYHLSMLSVKIVNAPLATVGALKFTSLDVSTVAILNMPVVMPFMNAVVLTGSTKFYLYNIFEDRFEQSADFTSPIFTSNIQPGSLKPGEFDLATYPDQRPCMAMFVDGANYIPRMFVLSTSRCKTRGAEGSCAECHQYLKLNANNRCNVCDFKNCAVKGTDCQCTTCNTGFRLKEGSAQCQPCEAGDMGYLGTCYPCAGITDRALQTWEGQIRCVERDTYINSGWGPRTEVPGALLLERCDVEGCQKCEANYLTCTECTASKVLNLNKCSANTPTSGTSSTPAFVSVLSNTFGLTFGPNQSRTINAVEVRDLNTQTLFSCAQLDCKYSWKGALLRISFTPTVTVTDGNIIIRRKHSQSSSVDQNRLLQSLDDTDIVIPNIKLTQTPGYIGWVTTGQVLLFLLRTVGSVLLFPKYPKLAMIPDLLITMSFILCAFLGPVVLMADSAFEIVGQIKILWFRMDSLVENWDTDTLILSTAPNTWKYPIFCSFLDNYSQNTVGLLALALLLTVAGYLARRVTQNKQSSPRMLAIATIVEKHYGTKFWLVKMYANSLEIMLYSLISFDKADASSKSIIGIMLAAVFVGAQVWLAVGATLITVNQPGTTDFTETARPYEQRPDTVMMTETHPLSTSSPPQTKFTEKAFRALGFGWQQMPSSNLKKVSRSKGFLETAFFFRNLGICLTILKVASSPQAQLIVAMCLQFTYVCYFIYCNVYLKKLEFVATLSLEAMMLVAILFKTLSTTPSTSESNLQNTLGALLLVALTVSIILTIGSFGLALVWNWSSQENDALEPTSFKPCTRTQPNPNGAVSSPADEVIPSNLKIIIEDHPKPSVGEEVLEQGMSMHSIPNEGENAQIDFGSIPVTEPQSV